MKMLTLSVSIAAGLTLYSSLVSAQTASKKEAPAPSLVRAKLGLDIASAAIQRGYTYVDGANIQPSLWLYGPMGLSAGFWGTIPLNDRDGTNPIFYEQSAGQFVKNDLFIGLRLPTPSFIAVDLYLAQYTFPQENLASINTIRDSIVKVSVPTLLNPFVSVSYGLSDPIEKDYYWEMGVQETLMQVNDHKVAATALTTYKNPEIETASKQEGQGHSQVAIAYTFNGVKLAGLYVVEGQRNVQAVRKSTEFSSSIGYSSIF